MTKGCGYWNNMFNKSDKHFEPVLPRTFALNSLVSGVDITNWRHFWFLFRREIQPIKLGHLLARNHPLKVHGEASKMAQ